MALSVFKKGQGSAARGFTGVVAVLLGGWASYQMWHTIFDWGMVPRILVTTIVALLFGGLPIYLTLFHRPAVDILIETQQEMRKVAWSSRGEIITSTIVIVFTIAALSIFILATDFVLWLLFRLLGLY